MVLERARAMAEQVARDAKAALEGMDADVEFFRELVDTTLFRRA